MFNVSHVARTLCVQFTLQARTLLLATALAPPLPSISLFVSWHNGQLICKKCFVLQPGKDFTYSLSLCIDLARILQIESELELKFELELNFIGSSFTAVAVIGCNLISLTQMTRYPFNSFSLSLSLSHSLLLSLFLLLKNFCNIFTKSLR